MTNPIKDAIEPQRAAAVAQALSAASRWVNAYVARFPVGVDLNLVAAYPMSSKLSRVEYLKARDEFNLTRSLLSYEIGSYDRNSRCNPAIVTGVNEEAVQEYLRKAEVEAGRSFDAYVAKLIGKVGDCDAATVAGYLWQHSILTVTKGSTVERWKTQQILNVSVLGKVFNQWPTRLLKK